MDKDGNTKVIIFFIQCCLPHPCSLYDTYYYYYYYYYYYIII